MICTMFLSKLQKVWHVICPFCGSEITLTSAVSNDLLCTRCGGELARG